MVSDDGKPKLYLFPVNYIVNKLGVQDKKHCLNFTYYEYNDGNSKAEYGISSAEKYYKDDNSGVVFYCISKEWDINNENSVGA